MDKILPLPDQNVEVCLEWSPCLEGVKKHRVLSKVLLPIKKGYLLFFKYLGIWKLDSYLFTKKFIKRRYKFTSGYLLCTSNSRPNTILTTLIST